MVTLYLKTTNTLPNPRFQFTYGMVHPSAYPTDITTGFNSYTYFDLINSVSDFEGFLNEIPLELYANRAYVKGLRLLPSSIEQSSPYKFTLKINDRIDSTTIVCPDTFGIRNHPPAEAIPKPPFTIKWNLPNNADFFIVYGIWEYGNNNIETEYFQHITDDTSFTFVQLPDSVNYGWIDITAISGEHPRKELTPNLEKLNGYVFSMRPSTNRLHFVTPNCNLVKIQGSEFNKDFDSPFETKIDEYLMSEFVKNDPQLKKISLKITK